MFVGVVHEKKAKIDGIWFDDKFSGRIILRNDVLNYPSICIYAKGKVKHPYMVDQENPENNSTSWSLQIPNPENGLF